MIHEKISGHCVVTIIFVKLCVCVQIHHVVVARQADNAFLNPSMRLLISSFAHIVFICVQILEDFKTTSPICSDVGFFLYAQNIEPQLRKCGLKLVEEFTKSSWNFLNNEKRNLCKLKVIELIKEAKVCEPGYLKESLVTVAVEIIKRSWPQQWETLFNDLSNLQRLGTAQLELVLIILMRLSEDVNGLDDNLTPARKKEMRSTLNNDMSNLFNFFIETLQSQALKLKERLADEVLHLSKLAIFTITTYATWVNFEHLLAKDKILLQVLFLLLEVKELKHHAADCLNTMFERKVPADKRKELLIILSRDVLNIVRKAASASMELASTDEEEYTFLKLLIETMCNYGRVQLASVWGDEKGISDRPECFDMYLGVMQVFSKHDSIMIGKVTMKLWNSFLVHQHIKKDPVFVAVIPELLDYLLKRLAKVGNLQTSDNTSRFNIMDFDDLEDLNDTLGELRNYALVAIRHVTEILPVVVRNHCMSKIKAGVSLMPSRTEGAELHQTMHYISWDALAQYCKNGFSSVYFKGKKKISLDEVNQFNELLRLLLNYDCKIALFLQPVVDCMESLFPIFKHNQDHLLATMQKLIGLIGLEIKRSTIEEVVLKRHACGAFSKLCKEIPEILATIFTDLEKHFGAEFERNLLSHHEKGLLLEGLLIICKHLKDIKKQKEFIENVFHLINSVFLQEDFQGALNDVNKFASYLGMDRETSDDAVEKRRNDYLMALHMCQSLSRSLIVTSENQVEDIVDNQLLAEHVNSLPWIQPMINILPHLLHIARQHCLLWTIENTFSPVNKNVLRQTNAENISVASKAGKDSSVNKIQATLKGVHDILYTTLSHYGVCTGPSLYSLPNLSDIIKERLTRHWIHLPNYKLRKIWRFLKSFVISCPLAYSESFIGPFLATVIPQMHERMCGEWKKMQQIAETVHKQKKDDKSDVTDEVLEARNLYNVSKEYIDVLACWCTFKRGRDKIEENAIEGYPEVIGKLGEFLLMHEGTNLALMCTLFTAMTWPDTSAVNRIHTLIIAIMKKMFTPSCPINPEIPQQLLLLVLQGLQVHGGDSAGQVSLTNIALHFYLQLRLQYPSLVQVMMMVPTCTEQQLKDFDLAVFAAEEPLTDAIKRKQFKKLIEGAYGKTLSQLHKKNVQMKDLPPLAPRIKVNKSVLDTDESNATLCDLFGQST